MALWVCTGCTAAYSVGAPRCPHCGSTEHAEEGQDDMPKITVNGGPSDASAPAGFTGTWGDEDEPETTEGSEESSPSSSSETSSEKPQTSPETSGSDSPSPARKTPSRSRKGRTGSSSAPSTGGDQTDDTSATASDKA